MRRTSGKLASARLTEAAFAVVRLRAHPKYIDTQFPATPAPTSMARITQFTAETFLRRPLPYTEGAEVSLPKSSYTAQTVVDTASDDTYVYSAAPRRISCPGIQFDCFPDGTERRIRGVGNTLYHPAGTLERTSPPGPM
jgi:hypothetical protein